MRHTAASMDAVVAFLSQHFAWASNPTVVARQTLAGISNGMLLFLISAGLSLIFGVSRILNFAHGVLFMLGACVTASLTGVLSESTGFLGALVLSAAALFVVGALIETTLLRRIYHAAHEFQLLLTFALVFVI